VVGILETMMGAHSTYTEEKAAEIVDRISDGEPLRQICRSDDMPSWRTVYRWMEENEGFAARFARARELGFDAIAQEALEIADTPEQGEEVTVKADGSEETKRADMLGHRKLRIETRLKLLAKWDPKRYGERTHVEVDDVTDRAEAMRKRREERMKKESGG
jgi:hypothetical protein